MQPLVETRQPVSEMEPPFERKRWPISIWIVPDLLVGFGLTAVLTFLLLAGVVYTKGATLSELRTMSSGDLMTPGVFVGSILIQNLTFTAIVLLRVRILRKLPWAWLGVHMQRVGRLLLIGIGLGIAFLAMNIVSGIIFSQVLGIKQNQAALFPITAGDTVGQALIFVVAALIAPIGEELLFRGYIFHAFKDDLGTVAAYVCSALLFAAPHLFGITQGASALLVPIFLGGLLLAWGVHATGSLVPSMIAHAINNGVAMATLLTCTNYAGLCTP